MNTRCIEVSNPLSKSIAALALTFLGWGATAAQAQPHLVVTNGSAPIAQLYVGDDLAVGLEGAVPFETYALRLLDSANIEIVAGVVEADAAGKVEPELLWAYTGVIGCDAAPPGNAAATEAADAADAGDAGESLPPHTYTYFSQAEAALNGETLRLEAFSSDGVLTVSTLLPVRIMPDELAYFSNAAGCLRQTFFNNEDVYLSLHHPSSTSVTRRIFLAPATPLLVGSLIADVRGMDGPQIWTLPSPIPSVATTRVWKAAQSLPGEYTGVLRWVSSGTPQLTRSDRVSSITETLLGRPTKGLLITVDGCPSCP